VREPARFVEDVPYDLALSDELLQVRVVELDALFLQAPANVNMAQRAGWVDSAMTSGCRRRAQ
jgi:hypothetical protein